MASDWRYRRYVSKDQDLYNDLQSDKYEIDQKFREAFKIIKKLGAEVPDEFFEGENYKKNYSCKM